MTTRKKIVKKAKPIKTSPHGAGVKFVEKYGCTIASGAYEMNPDKIVIPPPGHFLFDPDGNDAFNEERVAFIDKIGKYVGAIPVWSDPDTGKVYAIDGRGNVLDVREVNRRRKERGDDPITITVSRFPLKDEQAAQDYVAERNFLRKRPGILHIAREIARFKALGRDWLRIATILGLKKDDGTPEGEKELKKRIPAAYCIPEVIAAMEGKEISPKKAKKFGGGAMDGSSALGREEQLALLEEMRAKKAGKKAARETGKPATAKPPRAPKVTLTADLAADLVRRSEVASHLANGQVNHLKKDDLIIARAIAAYERYMAGETTALDYLPHVKTVIEATENITAMTAL